MLLTDAHREADRVPAASTSPQTIYVDVTDLLDYLAVNVSLSGIQRVVASLIIGSEGYAADHPGCSIVPVTPDYNGLAVHAVEAGHLRRLIGSVAQHGERGAIDELLQAVRLSRSRVYPMSADTLLIPGAFWIYQRYDLLNRLRYEGVRVAVFIHDLIQITHPDFVETAATTVFCRSFADVLSVSSYLLSNSHFVAREIERHLRDRMNFRLPVQPIPLATEFGVERADDHRAANDVIEVARDDFVLCVGTIEVRKNHLYLIKIWEKLIADGAAWIPNLVFVGKWGWEIDALRRHLDASDHLGGRLFIFNDVSDAELAVLYTRCRFTVYPSLFEGWGLPVGESLGYGKPCVASNATSIPEVGGDFCRYVDPFDWQDGYRVIADVLSDRPALDAWTRDVAAGFRPKSWHAFAHELFDTVTRFARDPALDRPGNNCIIENAEIVTVGNDVLDQINAKKGRLVTARMSRFSGWHGVEHWGCWAAKRRAVLKFRTTIDPGSEILVFLFISAPVNDLSAECTIACAGTSTFVEEIGPTPRWRTARGRVSDEGEVEITLIGGRGFRHTHGRNLYVGLHALALTGLHDHEGRARIVNAIVPGGLA